MASLAQLASQRQPSRAEQSSSLSSAPSDAVAQDTAPNQERIQPTGKEAPPSLIVALPMQTATNAAAAEAAHDATLKPEPRHCWICLQDEDEEGSDNSAWRSPCPCNLQAHEECMLEWIADLEAPRSRRNRPPNKILCPQCKAEIQIERPRDIIVSTVDLLRATGRALILPAGFSALFGCLYSGSLVYGFNSLYLVFGRDYADEIIRRQSAEPSVVRKLLGSRLYRFIFKLSEFTDPFIPTSELLSLELFFGLPLVAPALILARTKGLADYVFSIAPIPLFVLPLAFSSEDRHIRHWPPSPDLVIAVLPYVRSAYNELYRVMFSELEKKWDQAVMRKPREGESVEQVVQDQNEENGEGALIQIPVPGDMELVVDLGIVQDVEVPQEIRGAQPADAAAAEAGQNEAQPDGNAGAGDQQPNAPAGAQNGEGWGLAARDIYPADIASTIMGALFFPAISSLMGDLLKHTLPKKWVMKTVLTMSSRRVKTLPATGLLQEKWGRSIVGGCLFVVLKDALILYVKWKRARDHGKRKVLDYVAK